MEKKIKPEYEGLIMLIGLGVLGVKADEIIKENDLDESCKVDIINGILEKQYKSEELTNALEDLTK